MSQPCLYFYPFIRLYVFSLFLVLVCSWSPSSVCFFFFQAEDVILDLVRSRVLGDVYKRQHQHDENFTERAQQLAREQLGFDLPSQVLEDSWVCGLDLSALQSRCIFSGLKSCVENAQVEQAGWRQRMPLDEHFLRSCGYHTVSYTHLTLPKHYPV